MIEALTIEQEMHQQFQQLAKETHRTEAEIINEALAGYLAADRHYVEVLKQRIAAADRGEFASDDEVEAFFAERAKQ
jgi:RHH-type rel operon transcriptional repressor/antitoxin RelB